MLRGALNFVRVNLVLVVILAGFILLSSTGLFYNFGLVTTVNDETPPFVAALKMIADQTLRPAYPTFYYLPIAAYTLLPFVFLGVSTLPFFGVATTVDTVREFVILNFAQLLPWARLASVFYSMLAIVVLYQIARRVFARKETALLAAFFFSTSLLFVQLAHFGRVWGTMLLAILFTLWMILRFLEEPTLRRYLLAAAGIALSFGFNMIGALVYIPFVVAHALKHKGESFLQKFFSHREFLLAHVFLLASVCVFYYLNPYGFENYLKFFKTFFALLGTSSGIAHVTSGANAHFCGLGFVSGLIYYPRILLEYELPLLSFALIGVIFCWRRVIEKRNEVIILSSFALMYVIGITAISALGINTCEPRYILPVVPILALLSAVTITQVKEKVGKHFSIPLLVVVLLVALYGPVMFDLRLALPSTRLQAREWILTHIPSGARVVTLDETLNFPEDERTFRDIQTYTPTFLTKKRVYLLNNPSAQYSGTRYYVLTPSYFREGIPATLTKERYDYVVFRWWNPDDRMAQRENFKKLGLPGTLKHVARFPNAATDETESLDLPNNMRDPLLKLPALTQNGPVIDIYQLR